MLLRIGRVTNVYPTTGKVTVMYEDQNNVSVPLPMLTMNREYSMPAVGDMVVTLHMANGSTKGFVLGTYYGGDTQPAASSGYRKDFAKDIYVACKDGKYLLHTKDLVIEAENITMKCSYGEITVENLMTRLERIERALGLDSE